MGILTLNEKANRVRNLNHFSKYQLKEVLSSIIVNYGFVEDEFKLFDNAFKLANECKTPDGTFFCQLCKRTLGIYKKDVFISREGEDFNFYRIVCKFCNDKIKDIWKNE